MADKWRFVGDTLYAPNGAISYLNFEPEVGERIATLLNLAEGVPTEELRERVKVSGPKWRGIFVVIEHEGEKKNTLAHGIVSGGKLVEIEFDARDLVQQFGKWFTPQELLTMIDSVLFGGNEEPVPYTGNKVSVRFPKSHYA